MDIKLKRIFTLIEELRIGISLDDANYHLSFLSPEEIDKLLAKLEEVFRYQDSVKSLARQADPEGFNALESEYNDEILKIKKSLSEKIENEQSKLDQELDLIDQEASAAIDSDLQKVKTDLDNIEKEAGDEYSKLVS